MHAKCCVLEESQEMLDIKLLMQGKKQITNNLILSLVKKCTETKDVAAGKQIFSLVMSSRWCLSTFVYDYLIRMLAVLGHLSEANITFRNVLTPSIYTWNAIISAHVTHRDNAGALSLYYEMKKKGFLPDIVTFICILKACCNMEILRQGMVMHDHIIRGGFEPDLILGNALLDMYCKCGRLDEARKVFDALEKHDIVSWGTIIAGYVQHGHASYAFECFWRMQKHLVPNAFIFSSLVKTSCILDQGQFFHDMITRTFITADVVVENSLIDMYTKCGSIEDAKRVFDMLHNRDVVSWGAIIAGYAVHGPIHHAFSLFNDMQKAGVQPCKVTFLSILKACVTGVVVKNGRLIHDHVIRVGLQSDVVILNTLVDMYAKCGSLEEAHKIFTSLQHPTIVSWGALIAGYAMNDQYPLAIKLFKEMNYRSITISSCIASCILKVCGNLQYLRGVRHIHAQMIEHEIESDISGPLLIEVYAKCKSFEDAESIFELCKVNVESWAAIIVGYSNHGYFDSVFRLYCMMMQIQKIKPNNVIFSAILKACSGIGNIQKGRIIHECIVWTGMQTDIIIGNTLVGMYANFGSIEEAHHVFSTLPRPDHISWGAMMTGYVEHGYDVATLKLFEKLYLQGINPNETSFLSGLKACGNLGTCEQGMWIHDQIVRNGCELSVEIGSTILDMYGKCGMQREAVKIFNHLSRKDVVAWGALVAAYSLTGHGKLATEAFKDMHLHGVKPDEVFFTNVLSACSQGGLLEEGLFYSKSLLQDYGITPNIEQYSCMIDLFGRSGHLYEAEDILQTIPVLPDKVSWLSLLTSCRTYGNIHKGHTYYSEIT